MPTLAATPVPVPECLAYCADLEVNGAPFYVMSFVEGLILRDRDSTKALTAETADIAATMGAPAFQYR